jgi:tetratricopeptide (TPR) repeat protein
MDAGIIHALATLESEPDNADALAQLAALGEGGGNGHGRGGEAAPDTAVRRALTEARRIHRDRGDFELVARLIDLELGWETDKARQADLYYEKGKILSDELLREQDAVRAFERVLELRPDDEGTQDTLGHIALVRDNWQKIVKKYLDEAKDSTDRQLTTSLYLSVAEIYAKYQPDDHVEKYLRKALEVEPRNTKASVRLERLLRGESRWDELVKAIESRIEASPTKEERVHAYLALADVQARKLGQRNDAAESFKKALGIDPANPRALRALVEHYTHEENWQALIRVYENALRSRPRGESEIGVYLQIGMLWWKKVGNLESADEYWKKVRKAEPAHPAMLEFYRQYHAKEPAKLLAVLQQAQKVEADAKRRLDLSVETATVAEKASGAVEKAIDLWKAVVKLDPHNEAASHALKRLYEQTEKWNALIELLKERVEALPKDAIDERVARLGEVVAIYRDKLNLDVMVINTYNQILALRPENAGALQALAQKYEQLGRWNDLIGILTRSADTTEDRDEKTRVLRRIAALWIEKFGNFNQAVKPLEELYALSPVDPETVARLRDIYTRRRSWRALIDLERKEMERATGAERRAKLVEIAKLAAERLGDAREAISLWNRVLELDEGDAEALAALAQLYEREKRWLALAEVLRRQCARATDVKQQVLLLERVGSIFAERLGGTDQAIAAYQEIVRKLPTHQKAVRTLRELFAQGGRFDELEKLYAEGGQWEELCEVLSAVAERLNDANERVRLYMRVAELAQTRLHAPDRAAKAYERILAVDGQNRAAAEALVPIYRATEKWARLLSTYEILLGHARDDDERLGLHREIRTLCEEKLGSKGLAFTWCARAYEIRPTDAALEKELERLAQDAEAWEELVDIYAREVEHEKDDARRAERHRRLGQLLLRLHRDDEARKHFEALLERRPEDEEALSTLEQIFTQAQSFPELLAIYRRREGRAKDAQRRLEMLFKIAWIEEDKVADADAAIATYKKIQQVDPQSATQLRALRALEKLYAARSAYTDLAGVVEQQRALQKGDVDAEVALSLRLGEIYEQHLNRRGDALARYKAAFELAPGDKRVQTALERWLEPGESEGAGAEADEAARVEVARLLGPMYTQQAADREGARRLVSSLEIILKSQKDRKSQLEQLRRLAKLAERDLEDHKRAYDYAMRIFALDPADAENRASLAELAQRLECPDDLAVKLGGEEEKATLDGNATLARDLAWDLGQLFETRLGMPEDAEAAYRRVLERDPDHEGAYVALAQLYSSAERWKDLRALLTSRKGRALDSAARLALLYQISDLDEGVLGDETAAISDYVEILELDPGAHQAFRALDRLYTAQEKWRDLDALLERRAPHTTGESGTPESRAHLSFRRAELASARLDKPAQAVDLLEAALADEPRHEGARKLLETLMKRPELRQRIARALEPLYLADEAWPKLALVLGAQREAASGADAAALLVRLAELQEEKLGARQLALTTWREALRLDPADARVRENVERLAELLGRPGDLAQAWEEALAAADPKNIDLRGELLEKVAELYEHELRDIEKARAAWRRLLELDPGHLATARPAAAALARLYEAAEEWPRLIDVLHRQAEWAQKPEERKELLFRVGRIQEELTVDPKAAIRTYREILDGDPEDRAALDALERLHTAQNEWVELIDVLRRRLDLERDGRERRELLWRIAQLTEKQLQDVGDALAGYHAVLDEKTDDAAALDALARLYEREKRPVDLLDILERQLDLAESVNSPVAARVALRLRIATLLDGFGRRDQALERWAEILQLDDHHAEARAGLEKLLGDDELRLRAAEVLEPHYQAAGELDKLVALQELHARYAPDPRDRIGRLRRIAALEEQASKRALAFDAIARAARFAVGEPDLPSLLDDLERLKGGDENRQKLVELYRELGPDILDATTQERVYLQVAAESNTLGDRATAREYYRRVLDGAPDHPRALDAVEQLYLDGHEWDPLFEIYARRAELAGGDDDKRRHYLIKLAQLSERRELDRPSEAIRAYEQVLELYPNDADASKALEQHYLAQKRWVDLTELLEKRLGFAEEIEEAVALRFRLAQLFDEEMGDSDRAVENYRAALGGDPAHEGAIKALEKYLDDEAQRVSAAEVLESVYTLRHDWPGLVRIYQIRLEAADDPRARLALTRRIARLYEEQLEDLDAAFTWYGRVFREDPSDRANRDHLARLSGILDGWHRLSALYEDYLADVMDEGAVGIDVLRTLASVYHARLNDVDGARKCYKHLLQIDANDEAAFANLEQLLFRASRWQDLLELYRESAEAALDIDRKKALLFKQAAVVEEQLRDAEAAVDIYRAIVDLDADDARAVSALDRLYVQGKRWHDLVELLARRLERADGAAWVALELRLAGVYEGELDDRPAAIDAYEEVLRRTDGDRAQAPQRGEAVRALERLIVDHDHTFRIAQILEPIYRDHDSWQKLVVIYDAELEFIDDRRRRIELLREIARLHEERGGDGALAFGALARAWSEEVEEGDSPAREEELYAHLERLAKLLTMWRELAQTLTGAVDKTYDADLQAKIHARVAHVKEHHLADRAGAIESWQKVTRARDDDDDAWAALERLYDAEGRRRELTQVLEKRASLTMDVAAQKDLAYRAAALYETALDDRDQAIATWRQVLSLDDADRGALDALERLYRDKGAFRDLAQILARKIELESDEAARRPLRFALAQVSERELKDVFAAIDAYKGALAADVKDVEAWTELSRLYQGERLWADHLEALDALAGLAPGAQWIAIELRAAGVVEQQMGDAETAIGRYRKVLYADGAPAEALAGARAALERLLRDEGTRTAAADVLEPYYQERAEFAPLIELTELKLASENDPSERRALLARIAELNEAGVEDMQAAFVAWGRVLAEDASDQAAQAELERLAELQHAPGELARLYEERLSGSFDPEVQRALAWKLGVLYETKLGDEERAITAYHKTLELPGATAEAEREPLAALDRLLTRSMRWRELAEVLEREAAASADPAEQAELLFRLGALRAGELVDLDGALQSFAGALEREPHHEGARAGAEKLLASPPHVEAALDLLEPLFEADAHHEKLLALHETRLGVLREPGEKAALLERIAERAERHLEDAGRALDALARALALQPEEARLADEVERVARAARMDANAAAVFEHVLERGVSTDTARELGLRAARIWDALSANQPPAVDRAERRFRAVLDADATNGEALEALERIYRARGDAGRLAEVLARRAQEELDIARKKELYSEAARLHEGPLRDAQAAIGVWRTLVDVDESDGTALDALARLYEEGGRFPELVDALEQKARFADTPAAQAGLKGRIAALWAERLGDLDKAVQAYRDLLDLAPDSLAALEALEELEVRRGDFLAVQEVLVRRLQAVGSGAPQIPVYRKLAALAIEKQQSPDDAIGYIQEILTIAPDDAEAQAELDGLLERTGKLHDLVDILTERANRRAAAKDAAGEIALLVRAADLWEQKLGSPESATEILERILDRDPTSVRALASLARIYEGAHDVDRARATLERAIALAQTGAEQAELYFRIGKLEADANGDEAGEPWFAQALTADGTHAGAAGALEKHARARGEWARVAELLALRTERATGADQRALDLELAQVLNEKLGRATDALPYLERALKQTPDDPAVLEPLADLYFAAGRLDDARPLYAALAERMQKARRMKDVARLRSRIGQIAEKRGDAPGAIAEYAAALKIDPGHAATLASLGRLYLAAGDWENARGSYKKLLLSNLDASAGVSKADVYLALGEIHERQGEAPKAVGMFERGLELDGAHARLREALARVKK